MGRSFGSHFRGAPEVSDPGERLSDTFGNDALSDRDVVARCAEILGMEDWFDWAGFKDVPASYRRGWNSQ